MRPRFFFLWWCFFLISFSVHAQLQWPPITNQNKPWARWWWQGSAVDKANLNYNMGLYKAAGIGGLELTPIYGVQGKEASFIPFLSKQWMQLLTHTLNTARRLDLGMDMANGTGWPFGGPWVESEHASKTMAWKSFAVKGGDALDIPVMVLQEGFVRTANNKPVLPSALLQPVHANNNLQALAIDQVQFSGRMHLEALIAYPEKGKALNITHKVDTSGTLHWSAPVGTKWKLYALFSGLHGKMVERAAPGGEGYAIDHFSGQALDDYLSKFDTAFTGMDLSQLRSFFNDSYEVDDARGQSNWTPGLFAAFEQRRGYSLLDHLPALLQQDAKEKNSRVLYDYRATIDELILENFTQRWAGWAQGKGKWVRNQSHGSPANILDLYGAVDIPETEGNDILRFRFASSAANVLGKPLVSAEAATWLNEHFLSSWGDVKKAVDQFFLGGINHIFYHGINYSPREASWPGWLFYAATHFTPANPQWKHFPALNDYVARCQSFLQQGKPDNELLVYFPIADRYAQPGNEMLPHFDGMEKNWEGSPFEEVTTNLQKRGYSFDFCSDRQLQNMTAGNRGILSGQQAYSAILLPGNQYLPDASFQKLLDLVQEGATLLVYKAFPSSVPGFYQWEERVGRYLERVQQIPFKPVTLGLKEAVFGKGRIVVGSELEALLSAGGLRQEAMVKLDIHFTRRRNGNGHTYFLFNSSDKPFDGWLPVAKAHPGFALYDPLAKESGRARVRKGARGTEVYIQLEPKGSILLQSLPQQGREGLFPYKRWAGQTARITQPWQVRFLEGGPDIPLPFTTDSLGSWTLREDPSYRNFSGLTAYSTQVSKPSVTSKAYLLQLGKVAATAEVFWNGESMGSLIGPYFRLTIPGHKMKAQNELKIVVANLMANRIRYMDQQGIPWKIFYNINMSARYKEHLRNGVFDASNWKPQPSGLLGPVTLTPLQ